jgi:signal peptidase I
MKKDLRGTWPQALLTFFLPIFLILFLRWLIIEPYVIPSGSMIPTLHIHDHIFVNKLAFGIHIPFGKKWIVNWSSPKRGDIVVFRYPENPEIFYVKRVQGVGGDEIGLRDGHLLVNGNKVDLNPQDYTESEDGFQYFKEKNYTVRYRDPERANFHPVKVPEGHYFMMGDNRDQSSDSRFWGFVPQEYLIGRASVIWLACQSTLPSASFLCDPQTLRWDRFLLSVD